MTTLHFAQSLVESEHYGEAEQVLAEFLKTNPKDPQAHLSKGLIFLRQSKYMEAVQYWTTCQLDHPYPEIAHNAATAFDKLQRKEEAYAFLVQSLPYGDTCLPFLHNLLGRAQAANDRQTVEIVAAKLARIQPDDINTLLRAAGALASVNAKRASANLYESVRTMTENKEVLRATAQALAGLYKDMGDMPRAIKSFTETADDSNGMSNLIMSLQYTDGADMETFYQRNEAYNRKVIRWASRPFDHTDRYDSTKRLKVGFVSGDFVHHSLTALMLKPLEALVKSGDFDCYAYMSRTVEDEKNSSAYKAFFTNWVNINKMSDMEAAQKIHADGIDVLVDLAGHTAFHRLPVFGHCPAPLQIGWISGMMTPPGIETINYFLCEKTFIPPYEFIREKIIPLKASYCYFPSDELPVNPEQPAERNGFITFGAYNNPCKLNTRVIQAWAEIMRRVPESRLQCKIYDPMSARIYNDIFLQKGIGAHRVQWTTVPFPTTADMMKNYTNNIDIALDTWPCAGMLTSVEAMWMGVPVPTYTYPTFVGRQTASVLAQLELPELICHSIEDYILKTVALANDKDKLISIRRGLRERIQASNLRNPDLVSSELAGGIHQAWVEWCIRRRALQKVLRPVK